MFVHALKKALYVFVLTYVALSINYKKKKECLASLVCRINFKVNLRYRPRRLFYKRLLWSQRLTRAWKCRKNRQILQRRTSMKICRTVNTTAVESLICFRLKNKYKNVHRIIDVVTYLSVSLCEGYTNKKHPEAKVLGLIRRFCK